MKKHNIILLSLLLIGLLLRIIIIWQPANILVQYNADDMYYYLKIAQNINDGKGVSFDGIHPTNGFHPFYLAMLLPIMEFSLPDNLLAAHLALTILAVFNILTAYIIFQILKLVTKNDIISLFGVLIWLFNPWVIFNVTLGVEAPISTFFISAVILYYFKVRDRLLQKNNFGVINYRLIIIGILAGLTVLSRSDSIFLIMALGIDLAIIFFNKFGIKGFGKLVIACFLIAITTVIIVLPWIAWSQSRFGIPMQGSGMALLYNSHSNLDLGKTTDAVIHSVGYSSFKLLNYFIVVPFMFFMIGVIVGTALKWRLWKHAKLSKSVIYGSLILSGVIVVVSGLLKEARHYPDGLPIAITQLILGILVLILGLMAGIGMSLDLKPIKNAFIKYFVLWSFPTLVFGFYALYFWHHQVWYFLSVLLSLTLLLCIIASEFYKMGIKRLGTSKTKKIATLIFLIFILVFASRFITLYTEGINPWQIDMYNGAIELQSQTGSNDIIAAFNTGIYGYFSNRTVINLDGVVNYDIIAKKKDGMSLISYLRENDVKYVIDHPCVLQEIKDYALEIKDMGVQKEPFCENFGPRIYKLT